MNPSKNPENVTAVVRRSFVIVRPVIFRLVIFRLVIVRFGRSREPRRSSVGGRAMHCSKERGVAVTLCNAS